MMARKPNGYWNIKENVINEAKKYTYLHEFKRNCAGGYKSIRVNNWFKDLESILIRLNKPANYWVKESVLGEALKYTNKKDFLNAAPGATDAAFNNGWWEEATSHMVNVKTPNGYWNFERCYSEALKYNHKKDFENGNPSAYNASRVATWYDDITSHMKPQGNKYKRLIYAYEFIDGYVYVGLTYNLNKRNDNHLTNKKSQVYKHIQKTNSSYKLIELTDYLTVEEAILKEGEYVNRYINNDWIILNVQKTGGIGGSRKWFFEDCKTLAKGYKNKRKFSLGNPAAYAAAKNHGWLNDFFIKE